MDSYGPPHMAELKQNDQLEHTYCSCVRIRDVAQKTCQRQWTIGKWGERGSGISMLAARHDDDDDDDAYVICIVSGQCNQSFICCLPDAVTMHWRSPERWDIHLLLFFLTGTVYLRHFWNVRPYASLCVFSFLFSGPFVGVPWYTLKKILRILRREQHKY